jgi:hypothetical protein
MNTPSSYPKYLLRFSLLLLSVLVLPLSLRAQSQYAGTYFGPLNTQVIPITAWIWTSTVE